MKQYKQVILMLVCLVLPLAAPAQGQHWTVNVFDYQYDMTAYVALTVNGEQVADYSAYEIAAFCGDECRGVAEPLDIEWEGQTVHLAYLRIRSQVAEGEQITFKVYSRQKSAERVVDGVTLPFVAMDVAGLPSSPLPLSADFTLIGDLNSDGVVDITDVMRCTYYGVQGEYHEEADLNADGVVDILDVMRLTFIAIGKE